MIANILMYLVWLSVWLLLTWPPTFKNLIIGLGASYLVSLFKIDIFTSAGKKIKTKARSKNPITYIEKVGWFLIYVIVFLYECLKANLDVAYRVLHPDLPIRPGTIRVKISLKSDAGITFLANSVTLTPGTTTVDVDKAGGFLYVHWLYVLDGHDASNASLPVVEKFEKILRRIFE